MLGYYLSLALKSLRRSPVLTTLMVLSIGVGVALSMTTWQLVRMVSRDPIPEKSANLYVPQIDVWGGRAGNNSGSSHEPPNLLDYGAVTALLGDHRAKLQSAIYLISSVVTPHVNEGRPFNSVGFAVSREFFPMLNVPFIHGGTWSMDDETARAQVVVISQEVNRKVFGGGDNVGKILNIDGHSYRVAGILSNWNPEPVFYDVPATGGFLLQTPGVFLPFDVAITEKIPNAGETDCKVPPSQSGFDGLLHSSCVWISYIVELDTANAFKEYKLYLEGVAHERYSWPPNVRLRNLMSWLDYLQVVPDSFNILWMVGFGLLVVCVVDTIGLMLAKFLSRNLEISVRRALGATRPAIYAQILTEGAVIGAAGGITSFPLTWLGLLWVRSRAPRGWELLTSVDVGLFVLALAVAVIATLLASLYPAWRSAQVQPAWQLKSN